MSATPGRRERKKDQTRVLIAETAQRLFAERGFDGVTVAEVARAADVAEKTVFNYFPTKEDLFYFRMESFEQQLLEAVAARAPGESVLAAFGRFLLQERGLLAAAQAGDAGARERLQTFNRVIAESPSLRAREQQIFARYTASLAALIAAETNAAADDVRPRVAAAAMMGVHRALIDYVRTRSLAGDEAGRIASGLRNQCKRALALLGDELGDYGR